MKNFPSIKKHADFQAVYRHADSKATGLLVMYKIPNGLDYSRIGISASKRVGNSVVRHTFARKIREIFRLQQFQTVQGFDIVVVARNQAKEASYERLMNDYLRLLSYHNLKLELS